MDAEITSGNYLHDCDNDNYDNNDYYNDDNDNKLKL